MEADKLQTVWQSAERGRQIVVDADAVLKLVQRNHSSLQSAVFWRDVREVGAGVIVAAFFTYCGARDHFWPLFVTAALCLSVALFLLADRFRARWKVTTPGETVVAWVESSLADVEHQIWLLKNVLWWYLSPLWAGCVFLVACVGLLPGNDHNLAGNWKIEAFLVIFVFALTALCYGVYRLNQYAVRTELQPRKQELQALLESLRTSGG